MFGGFGGEIASHLAKECFLDLDAPVRRVGQSYVPTPFAKVLESAMQLGPRRILEAVRETVRF